MITTTVSRSWNRAYVLKKMKDRDFSGLDDVCLSTQYLLDENSASVPTELEKLYWLVQEFFEWFMPDADLFVMAGPVTICSLAFAHLLERFEEICVAVYSNGRYDYYAASSLPKMGIQMLKFRGDD